MNLLPTFTPPVAPSPGTTRRPDIKILRAEFGDGYTQATPKGLNHIRQVIELRWEVLEAEDKADIVGFLERQQGTQPFHYAVPGECRHTWTCSEWSIQTLPAQLYGVTATLRQYFGAEAV